ncbi:MAG: hypothetical protein DHS20C05_14420 [Hyphococcus sp.]|nr:MAG: hypothetical protein DHS20C05_14420 [Marinicaulis sp.]
MFTGTILKKFTIIGAAFMMLGACATLPSSGGLSGASGDFARGSALGGSLSGGDRNALSAAVMRAMETGQAQRWAGSRAAGVVTPGEYSLANLKSDPAKRIPLAHKGIELNHAMETELGLYVLTRNSNIRVGPGTDKSKVQILNAGAGVEVVGGVIGENWMLVAHEGRIVGYVFRDLLIKAPGTELDLAGGPHRRPILCRELSQKVSIFSENDEWTGAACQAGSSWRAAPEPVIEIDPDDDDLLGL